MADPRTFVLIGEFKDGITPELQKINNQLAALKTSFSNLGGKGARNASRDMGRFSAAVSSLTENLKANNQELRASIAPLREYRREIGKTVAAYKQLNAAGGNTKGLEATNKALREQMRLMEQVRTKGAALSASQGVMTRRMSQTRQAQAAMAMGGGYTPPPRGGGGGGRGSHGMGPGGFHMAEFGFAYTLGNAIAQPIQNAIVSGFQIGVGLMTKPFQYFASAFGERVQDELSDLKAAGGLYSVSKRSKNPFLKDIDQAIQFQQDTNETFAKMAASLPGVTNDYVQVGKRLSDTAARIVSTDFEKARQEANRIRATAEGGKFYGATPITGTGAEQQREVIQTLLGELTKKTTIAGLGGRTGAGGIAGAYGLPGLTERMLSQEEVSMGQFQRYAAVFSDPTIADALQRNIEKINATQLNTVDRYKAIQQLLDEVVTPELIEKLRTSVDGIYQGFKATFFDPDTGLFGLGRNFKAFGKKLNQYGQYVNAAGKVVDDINEAASEDLSLFEIIRDVFSNLGQVLLPIAEMLPSIFDPLKNIANVLMDARHYAAELNRTFNDYRNGLKALSEQKGNEFLKDSLDFRAAMAAVNNMLKQFGVINAAEFESFANQLMARKLNTGKIMTEMLDKLLNSDIAEEVGSLIGELIGTVLSEVAKVTGFISGRVESSNKLFEGIRKGFTDAGGPAAIKAIFSDVFKTMFKVLIEVMKVIPVEGYMIMAAMVVIPAAVQGLAMAIASGITGALGILGKRLTGEIVETAAGAGGAAAARKAVASRSAALSGLSSLFVPAAARTRKAGRSPLGRGFFGTTGYSAPIGPTPRGRAGEAVANRRGGAGYMSSRMLPGRGAQALSRAGAFARGVGRFAPGGALALGGIDASLRMAQGESVGKAIGGAAATTVGSVLGGILGQALIPIPGVGAAIGGVAGGIIGDKLYSSVFPSAEEQKKAANTQMEAARQQLAAASDTAAAKYGKFGPQLGGVEALNKALGGGAGVQQYAQEQLRLGKILPEQAQNWMLFGDELSAVNKTTSNVEKAQKAYDAAVKANTGKQKEYKAALEKAQQEQQAALSRITKSWEEMSSQNRIKLLGAADNIVLALNEAAAKIRGVQFQGPGPKPSNKPTPSPAPSTSDSPIDKPPSQRNQQPPLSTGPVIMAPAYQGRLGDAIASEMKHKPRNSHLVVANSSETVIPAAGGHGMMDFVETLRWGFSAMMGAFREAQQKQDTLLKSINQTLISNQQATNAKLTALEKKFSTPGVAGGLGGASAGGVDAFTGMAQSYGLQMTSGYRPGDPGWHGANRARDFSNGTGPTPQMMAFAQFLASTYGSNLKELIYTPLGFSIKNGQRVAPYAQGSHYNHVHVAYAMGLGQGVAFNSLQGAQAWEKSMTAGSVRVASVTGNSAEGFGTTIQGGINVTVNAGNISDPDILADVVAQRILSEMQSDSIFV